jgi:hypothetical protein
MFISLRAGSLDEILGDKPAAKEPPRSAPDGDTTSPSARLSKRPLSNPNLRKTAPDKAEPDSERQATEAGSSVRPLKRAAGDSRRPIRSARRSKSHPAPAEAEPRGRYAASRPAAIFGEATPRENIFGDRVISEQSLDEVILSYLAEDLEGTQK